MITKFKSMYLKPMHLNTNLLAGLMDILHSEAELAAVIGHETAHVLARHHAERMTHAGW